MVGNLTVEVTVPPGQQLHYQVLVFDEYPTLCRDPIEIPIVAGVGQTEQPIPLGPGCSFATLIATNLAVNNAEPSWTASFEPADGLFPETGLYGVLNCTTGTTHVVHYDAPEVGALLIAQVVNDRTTTVATPAEWTLLYTTAARTIRLSIYYEIADQTEEQEVVFITSASAALSAHITAITNWQGPHHLR